MISLQIQLIDKAGETIEDKDAASEGEKKDGTIELCHSSAVKELIDSFFADFGEIFDGDRIEIKVGGEE